jgi:hypothetical protein
LLINSQITKINPHASPEKYIENGKTVISLRKRFLLRQQLKASEIEVNKNFINDQVYLYYQNEFEGKEENEFEELVTYLKIYILKHIAKSSLCLKAFTNLSNLFSVKNLYKQILYHRSYGRFRD